MKAALENMHAEALAGTHNFVIELNAWFLKHEHAIDREDYNFGTRGGKFPFVVTVETEDDG